MYIYFYNSVLIVNLETNQVHYYAIPDSAGLNGNMYHLVEEKEFTAGNWTYRCKKGLTGYVKLLRSDGEQVQVLVEMPGTGRFFLSAILPGMATVVLIMLIRPWSLIRKARL